MAGRAERRGEGREEGGDKYLCREYQWHRNLPILRPDRSYLPRARIISKKSRKIDRKILRRSFDLYHRARVGNQNRKIINHVIRRYDRNAFRNFEI
jgi:hypothetical protein